jgi:hypothetical protein
VGTTVTCRTCFATEIEGEVLAFNAHTRMVIIEPTPTSGKPLRNGMHMVNLDFVKDIRVMRVCTNKPPEANSFDIERLHTSVKEGVEKEKKFVMAMEAREPPKEKDLFTEEEYWSGDDPDTSFHNQEGEIAPLDASYPTMRALSDSKKRQTHNRMSAMYESTNREDVKNEPYQEQNHGSVTCHTTKTMKEGEIAPLDALYPTIRVLSDSKKLQTRNRMSAMNENTYRGDVKDKTYQENGNCAKNVLMSAPHYPRGRQSDTIGPALMARTCTKIRGQRRSR